MNIVNHILSKIIVKDFYKRNAWWMLVLFMALFGLVQQPVKLHKHLMYYINTNGKALLFYILSIGIYTLNTIIFQINLLRKHENRFLQSLCLLDNKRKATIIYGLQMILLAPILLYTIATILVGYSNHLYNNSNTLTIALIVLLFTGTIIVTKHINNRSKNITFPNIKIKIPHFFTGLLCNYIWKEKRSKLLWCKIASTLALSIPLIRNSDSFYLSDFSIFWAASLGANLVLLYDVFVFFNTGLRFTRQLPISLYTLYCQLLVTGVAIIVPECLLVWIYRSGLRDINTLEYCIYTLGTQLLLYNILWDKKTDFSQFMGVSALFLIGQLFLTPFKIFSLLGLVFIAVGFILFASNYYHYEYVTEDKGTTVRNTSKH
ncbi:MAG: hypothetical protein QM610_12120 [Chitinophagaceae bacterium]